MCWCICTVASFVRGSRQVLQGGGGGGQDMILFSSRVQGPFQKLNNVNLLNLNFPRKGVIPDPPSLNPRMKRIPCMSVSLLLIKTTGHPFSFQNDFLIM